MKMFRIKKLNREVLSYRVDQRHTFLFFLHYWDIGAYCMCPKYLFDTKEEALDAIAKTVTKMPEE